MTQSWGNCCARGIHFVQFFGQDTCREMKNTGKNTEKHLTGKKGKSLKLINILLFFKKENVFLESHKGFQKTNPNNICLPQVLATGWGATLFGGGKTTYTTGEIELIVCFTDGGGGD